MIMKKYDNLSNAAREILIPWAVVELLVFCRRSLSVAEELRAKATAVVVLPISFVASHTSYKDKKRH